MAHKVFMTSALPYWLHLFFSTFWTRFFLSLTLILPISQLQAQ